MRRFKIVGLALGVVIAVMAASAGGASAASKLVVREHGTPVTAGTTVGGYVAEEWGPEVEPFLQRENFCEHEGPGTLSTNEKSKDKFAFGSYESEGCSSFGGKELSESESLPTITLAAAGTGTVKYKPKLVLTEGSCVYEFAKLTGNLAVGDAIVNGEAIGKRNKKLSGTSCAATLTVTFQATLFSFTDRNIFETEVKP
jgi:hypothetical protein